MPKTLSEVSRLLGVSQLPGHPFSKQEEQSILRDTEEALARYGEDYLKKYPQYFLEQLEGLRM